MLAVDDINIFLDGVGRLLPFDAPVNCEAEVEINGSP